MAGHGSVILTPNGGEFARLWSAVFSSAHSAAAPPASGNATAVDGVEGAVSLAWRLVSLEARDYIQLGGNASVTGAGEGAIVWGDRLEARDAAAATGVAAPVSSVRAGEGPRLPPTSSSLAVLRKGPIDAIAVAVAGAGARAGRSLSLELTEGGAGSPRRCGGQGDVLTGVLGAFLAWAARAPLRPASAAAGLGAAAGVGLPPEALLACASSASRVTRAAAALAYAAHGRAMTSPDLVAALGPAFQAIHPDPRADAEAGPGL